MADLPGGAHLAQEADLEVGAGGEHPLPALDAGAHGGLGEHEDGRPGHQVQQLPV